MPEVFPSRAAIVQSQIAQLGGLIDALIPANRFYANKLSQADPPKPFRGLEDFAKRVPFTTKAEIVEDQQRHPPYGTNLTFPLEHYTRCHQTSGSTGTPLRWLDTPESWGRMRT